MIIFLIIINSHKDGDIENVKRNKVNRGGKTFAFSCNRMTERKVWQPLLKKGHLTSQTAKVYYKVRSLNNENSLVSRYVMLVC